MEKNRKIVLYLFTILLLIFSGITIYNRGSHALDLAHNGRIYEVRNNISLIDRSSNHKAYSMIDLYIIGSNMMDIGLIISIIGFYLFGLISGKII